MAVETSVAPQAAAARSDRSRLAGIEAWLTKWFTARRLFRYGIVAAALLAIPGLLTAADVLKGSLFDYNLEYNVPSGVSAAMLVFATVAALLWCDLAAPTRQAKILGRLLACVFLYMSADEFVQLHEKLENRIGVDWEVLYLPIMAVAAVTSLMILRKYCTDRNARLVYILGASGWALAAILEKFEYNAHDQQVHGYKVMMVLEENGELIGSLLMGVALLLALEAVRSRRAAQAQSAVEGPEPERISYVPVEPISYRAR